MPIRRLALLVAALGSAFGIHPLAAADLRAPPPAVVVESKLPPCGDPDVLADVEDQFEYGAPRMLQQVITVEEFRNLFERGYLPRSERWPIERRYCQGEVLLSTGVEHELYYVIEHPMGFASIGWRAEGCVQGLDRWRVYGADCQSLRRF